MDAPLISSLHDVVLHRIQVSASLWGRNDNRRTIEVSLRPTPYTRLASSRLSHHVSVVIQPRAETVLGMSIPSLPPCPAMLCSVF